ncbi:MAG: hypothetical protein GY861_06485 [bacterium]|nr:hypothetical protein [bacterium]
MPLDLNLFNSMDFLEPKCPKCGVILDYGENTRFDRKENAHICDGCGLLLK